MSYKIIIDENKCIGCGACTDVCDNFELNDGKSYPKKREVDKIGCNTEAEKGCPVNAINVKEIK